MAKRKDCKSYLRVFKEFFWCCTEGLGNFIQSVDLHIRWSFSFEALNVLIIDTGFFSQLFLSHFGSKAVFADVLTNVLATFFHDRIVIRCFKT